MAREVRVLHYFYFFLITHSILHEKQYVDVLYLTSS